MIVEGVLVDALDGERRGQVEIRDGMIARVGDGLGTPDIKCQEGQLIFPGFGDIHVHLREGQEHKEDYATGAAACLQGGVTFCLDMPNNPKPPIDGAGVHRKLVKAEAGAPVAIGIYAGVGPETQPFNHTHYKAFMASSFGPLYFDSLPQVEQTMPRYRGCKVTFHCEDPELITEHERPAEAERVAVELACRLKEHLDVNVAHLSTKAGLDAIRAAAHKPKCEVTPHHLYFDVVNRERMERKTLLRMNPPLREPRDREALLEAFANGEIDFLATDHAPHTLEEKLSSSPPAGVPMLDTYGAFVAWLIVERKLTPQHLARHASYLPGQWFGGPHGRIGPGFRGDLAILDLTKPWTVRAEDLRTKCGWSPFEGQTLPGQVAYTVCAGRVFQKGREIT